MGVDGTILAWRGSQAFGQPPFFFFSEFIA
jgi:hypothetical protein